MRRCMRSQHSSPRNHGLSKSRGIRKRRFGGILRGVSAASDQVTTILNHMATRTAQVGYLPSRSLRPRNALALLRSELNFLSSPYFCIRISAAQSPSVSVHLRSWPKRYSLHSRSKNSTHSAISIAQIPVPVPRSSIRGGS